MSKAVGAPQSYGRPVRNVAKPPGTKSWTQTRLHGPQCMGDMPPRETKRWVIRRKADVVLGVSNGVLTLEEACARYNLSVEEFLSWQSLIDRHGISGLRATRLKTYRTRQF